MKAVFLLVVLVGAVTSAEIECPMFCPFNWAPVCGSDGKTYGNDCSLTVAACQAGKIGVKITKLADGECKVAVQETTQPPTKAPETCMIMCTMQYDPVCGTDGRTYGNACSLKSAACFRAQEGEKLSMAYAGACKPVRK